MTNVYPHSFDFTRDSEKINGAQRTLLYNIYRSNPKINGFSFTSFGVSDAIVKFLESNGIKVKYLSENEDLDESKLVIVGSPHGSSFEDALFKLVDNGSNVLFTDIEYFMENELLLRKIAGEEAFVQDVIGTIYHNDNICISHPVFEGISSSSGILEFDKFGSVYPDFAFLGITKPQKTICASVKIEIAEVVHGLSIGEFIHGKGKFVLNAFRINEFINKHPLADMLLLNLIDFYGDL